MDINHRSGFFVYIIESPSHVDLYHKRYEGEMLHKALSLAGIFSIHRLAVNLEAFTASITIGLEESLKIANSYPIIHISSHGHKDGIQLTDGSIINWDNLYNLISPINKNLNGNLLLCMSTCEGFNGCRMAMREGDNPFLGLIGNTGKPNWSETAIGFSTFYHLLSKGVGIRDAVNAMRIASGNKDFLDMPGSVAQNYYLEEIKKERVNALLEALRQNRSKLPQSPLQKALEERIE